MQTISNIGATKGKQIKDYFILLTKTITQERYKSFKLQRMGRHKKNYQHGSFRNLFIADKHQGEAED